MQYNVFQNDFYDDKPGLPWAYRLVVTSNGVPKIDILTKSVISARLPEMTLATDVAYFMGRKYTIPTRYRNSGTFQLTFSENKFLQVYNSLKKALFASSFYNSDYGFSIDHPISIRIDVLDPTVTNLKDTKTVTGDRNDILGLVYNKARIVASYYFKNCYVDSLSDLDLDYSSEEIIEWEVTMQYNGIVIDHPNKSQLEIPDEAFTMPTQLNTGEEQTVIIDLNQKFGDGKGNGVGGTGYGDGSGNGDGYGTMGGAIPVEGNVVSIGSAEGIETTDDNGFIYTGNSEEDKDVYIDPNTDYTGDGVPEEIVRAQNKFKSEDDIRVSIDSEYESIYGGNRGTNIDGDGNLINLKDEVAKSLQNEDPSEKFNDEILTKAIDEAKSGVEGFDEASLEDQTKIAVEFAKREISNLEIETEFEEVKKRNLENNVAYTEEDEKMEMFTRENYCQLLEIHKAGHAGSDQKLSGSAWKLRNSNDYRNWENWRMTHLQMVPGILNEGLAVEPNDLH